MLLVLLSIVPHLVQMTYEVNTLAKLACGEAGGSKIESARVLRVVRNRSIKRNTSAFTEAVRPYQFWLKGCSGKRAVWLKDFHYRLALSTLSGSIKAKDKVINDPKVTHFATTKRLGKLHSRCKGHTIRSVWSYSGLKPVLKTELGHEFFKQVKKYRPGCPPDVSK